MKLLICLTCCLITGSTLAANEGLNAVIGRRKVMRMQPLTKRVIAQRMDNGILLSVYDDNTVSTAAVSVVKMAPTTQAKIIDLQDDIATLAAARSLAARVRKSHPAESGTMPDAQIIATADTVLDNSARDTAGGGALGAVLGAAATAAALNRKKKGQKNDQ